jgi:hypothetical protein
VAAFGFGYVPKDAASPSWWMRCASGTADATDILHHLGSMFVRGIGCAATEIDHAEEGTH